MRGSYSGLESGKVRRGQPQFNARIIDYDKVIVTMRPGLHWLYVLGGLFLAAFLRAAPAQPVVTEISGVEGELLTNVRAHLSLVRAESFDEISVWRLRRMAQDAPSEASRALRPFGYYRPRVNVRLIEPETEDRPWRAQVRITPGDPVVLGEVNVEIAGEGREDASIRDWLGRWPLRAGSVLRHAEYERALRELDNDAIRLGYFRGRYTERRVEVDPDRGEAGVQVSYDTGPRYRIGAIDYGDTGFKTRLMERLTVIEPGEPYAVERIDEQRDVLVRSAYFQSVAVDQERRDEDAEVDLAYRLERRPPNTWRATVGFGTDTGPRIRLGWIRHYLSERGDRLDTAFGVQRRNKEFVLRSEYQHPFRSRPGDFLTGGTLLKRERDAFRFQDEDRREAVFEDFNGDREQIQFSAGRLRERRLFPARYEPLRERVFIAWLHESFDALRDAAFSEEQQALFEANPAIEPFLKTNTQTLSLGAEWQLLNLEGAGFATSGEHYQVRVLGAHESLGSDESFLQGWVSGRWHWLFADRHKLIIRGEAGYTRASTTELDIRLDDRQLDLSITELPELYRFKTGGDRTVRGYGYERLSTNRNGANNILVGSAEYEVRVGDNWSLAAFYDIGNAFNDFDKLKLKRGVGVGFRWYTLIGPVQVDVARALDDLGKPYRLHFTIGTRLL